MAIRAQRFLGHHHHHLSLLKSTTRYSSSLPLSPFSTLEESPQSNNHTNIDEQFVLNELSELLPLNPPKTTLIYNHFTETTLQEKQLIEKRRFDCLLSPGEKLRGVFLHKLKGNAAVESALTAANVDLTVETVREVLNRGNLGGEAMVVFFNWATKHPTLPKDLGSYHVILKALGRRKFFDYIEEMLREMRKRGVKFSAETLMIVMDSFVRARRVSKALEFFGSLEEFGLSRDTESFNVLLECLCRRSHVRVANSLLNSMKGKILFDRRTYNVIIGGWSKLGKMSEVEGILKAMEVEGYNPDCLTFSYVIEALGRDGRVDESVNIFEKMEEKGCVPDTIVYNAMILNFVSVGSFDECMNCYKAMLKKNCTPDIDTYTILISALLKTKRVADALELFHEMVGKGILPSTGMITSFLEPLCSFGPPYAALMIYKKSRKVGCVLSLKAYKLLLMSLSRFGKCGMILTIRNEMQECGYSLDMEVYEHVINGHCNIGQLENAVLVLEEALRKGFCPSKFLYRQLNNKLLSANKVERAYRLFLKVKKARLSENAHRYWRANGWHF